MDVGVKECSKNVLRKESGEDMEARKTEIANGKIIDRRNCRLLTKKVVRHK